MPSFTFNGVPYTTARVGNNGLIVFGSSAGEIHFINQPLPSTFNSAGNVFIAPFWDDLYPNPSNTTSIKTQTVGSLFIIQYTLTSSFGDVFNDNGTGTITFQVQLDLTTGAIHYVYQDELPCRLILYSAGCVLKGRRENMVETEKSLALAGHKVGHEADERLYTDVHNAEVI